MKTLKEEVLITYSFHVYLIVFPQFVGAFISVEIKGNVDKFHYFGTGETFLFSFAADPVKYEWRESHTQSYFVAGDNSCFAIGGGGK